MSRSEQTTTPSLREDSELFSKLSTEYINTFWSKTDESITEAAKGLF